MIYTLELSKLYIGTAFRFACQILSQDCRSNYCPTILKYSLQLINCCSIIYTLYKDRFHILLFCLFLCSVNGTFPDVCCLGLRDMFRLFCRLVWLIVFLGGLHMIQIKILLQIMNQYQNSQQQLTESAGIQLKQIKLSFSTKQPNYFIKQPTLCCKICLEELKFINSSNIFKQSIVSPCFCTGSMKYVHQKCIVHWLNTQMNKNLQNNRHNAYNNISCEICKSVYQYQTSKGIACLSLEEIKQNIKDYWKQFIFVVLFTLLSFIGLGVLGYFDFVVKLDFDPYHVYFIVLAAFFATMAGLLVGRFTYVYLLKWVHCVRRVKDKNAANRTMTLDTSNYPLNQMRR